MADELLSMATALKAMKRSNSGLTWIRQKHVTEFLQNLAIAPLITHEAFDALPKSHTRDFVRGLLVEHGALPPDATSTVPATRSGQRRRSNASETQRTATCFGATSGGTTCAG